MRRSTATRVQGPRYKDVRVLAGLYYNPNQVVARADSGVASLADFKGKSFAPGAAGGTTEVESRIHFTETGLKYPDDIKAHFVGFTESIDLMRNKQLDGVWIMAGMPTAAVTEMCSTANGKLVGMDDELIARYRRSIRGIPSSPFRREPMTDRPNPSNLPRASSSRSVRNPAWSERSSYSAQEAQGGSWRDSPGDEAM